MPNIRCKWYNTDGTPIRGGCPTPGCRFIHPEQMAWKSLRHQRSSVRCMYFDSYGRPINGGCHSFRDCRFIHPEDSDWGVVEKPKGQLERKSRSPAATSVSRSTQQDTDQRSIVSKDSRTVRPAGTLKAERDSVERRTPTLSNAFVVPQKSKDPLSITTDVDAELNRAAMPLPSLPSSRHSQMDPQRSSVASEFGSALSKITDEDVLRHTWRRRISLISQARDIVQKLSEIETDLKRRTALESIIPVIASSAESNLDALKDSARMERDILEEKMNAVITQLIEEDIWRLPRTAQSDFFVERRQLVLSASISELGRRLDVMVTQFNQISEMSKLHQGSVSVVPGGEEHDMLRPSKRRRISANGSFQAPFHLEDILARLDSLQSKANELEAESLHECLLEAIDERIEGRLVENPVAGPAFPDSLNDMVQNLDSDLDVLCGELANLDTGGLTSQIKTLHQETGGLKQTIESLASDQQLLQQRQADLDQQTCKIMEELKELRIMPDDKPKIAINSEELGDIALDVQKNIDAEKAQLHNMIKSCHEGIKNTIFAGLEPMVIKTEMMYNYLRSQANAS